MKKKKKLNLANLKVESFETTLEDTSLKAAAGGSITHSGCWPTGNYTKGECV